MSDTGKLIGSVVEVEDETGVHRVLVLDQHYILNGLLDAFIGKKIMLRVEVCDEMNMTEQTKKELNVCSYCERALGTHNPACPKPG